MYVCGHLHRDPSLGNFLTALANKEMGETKHGFEIPQEFLDHLSSLADDAVKEREKAGEEVKDAEVRKEVEEVVKDIKGCCAEVVKLASERRPENEFYASITDGDLAVSWKTYWGTERRMAKSVSKFLAS